MLRHVRRLTLVMSLSLFRAVGERYLCGAADGYAGGGGGGGGEVWWRGGSVVGIMWSDGHKDAGITVYVVITDKAVVA